MKDNLFPLKAPNLLGGKLPSLKIKMGLTLTCNKCNKNYKQLSREGLCVFCSNQKHGQWPKDFTKERDVRHQ